jgi:hypothetical protein
MLHNYSEVSKLLKDERHKKEMLSGKNEFQTVYFVIIDGLIDTVNIDLLRKYKKSLIRLGCERYFDKSKRAKYLT